MNKRLIRSGSRLDHLAAMIQPSYSTIWDCCCDHGHLGMRLVKERCADQVRFLDLMENIMTALAAKQARDLPQQQY